MDARTARDPRRVVVGLDPSEDAAHAVDWAAALTGDLDAVLVVAHALDLRSSAVLAADPASFTARHTEAGEQLLARTVVRIAQRHPRLTVRRELSDSDPVHLLTELAAGADLLVTGTRGHGGFTGAVLGSVSNALAAHAPCPLAVVGTRPAVATRPEIVLGIGHKQERPPIDFALAMASRLGLSVRAVLGFEPWLTYGGSSSAAAPILLDEARDVLDPAHAEYPEVALTVEYSDRVAVPSLVEAGDGARLIVVGSHRRHGLLAFGPGHIVHGLLAHARTPVAVVPIP